ncbi:MAG: cysteine desulfurase [Clostridia bacterium]|nr:cysteine desulfurase [Clostridia bacterium]
MMGIYLDNAATTRPSAHVLEVMRDASLNCWGNPSSIHAEGRAARKCVEKARRQTAEALHAGEAREICFTSGGTEADNWALRGVAHALRGQGRHLITTQVEHHAVLHTAEMLAAEGFRVTYLPVDAEGRVSPADVAAAIEPDTILISVMAANNELGTLQPIGEIGEIAHSQGVLFHTDAVQAVGAVLLSLSELPVDLLSLSAHKLHGPKGIGALYIRRGTRIDGLLKGGQQERSLRPGTEAVAAIAGLGAAITDAVETLPERTARIAALRDELWERLRDIPGIRRNSPERDVLPGLLNVCLPGCEGEALLLRLDLEDISASSGSACTTGAPEPSHVLRAIGLDEEAVRSSIRFSIGDENTAEDIAIAAEAIRRISADLRRLRGWKG